MINLEEAYNRSASDIESVNKWADSEYAAYFADYFKGERELYDKMKTNQALITDAELEWILTSLPLELFSVSEQSSKLKTAQEVIKLHIKSTEHDYMQSHPDLSATARKEEAMQLTAEDRLLVTVYNSLIERVDKEISFSRELVMAAKKIWDARRSAEEPLPYTKDTLPEYVPDAPTKQYIK